MVRPVTASRQVIGPYQILRVIAKGGMGTVYEAVHSTIERRAAIKVLRDDLEAGGELIERFLNEARAVNRIGHPGIVQIYDVGRLENDTIYLVMEYLEGVTLGQRIKERGGRLSAAEVVLLGGELAHALAAAHDKGVVHRDLKPDNIMIVSDPHSARGERAKLLDFGIAKLVQSASESGAGSSRTKVGTTMGTPWYMSPEQVVNTSGVGDRSDVYSLGVLLYQALSGQLPLHGDSDFSTMSLHVHTPAPALASVAPTVPKRLAQLVDVMLEKSPTARPRMIEVVHELAAIRREVAAPELEQAPVSLHRESGGRPAAPVPMTLVRSVRSSGPPPARPAVSASPPSPATPSSLTPSTLSGAASQHRGSPGADRPKWGYWLAPLAVTLMGLGLWYGRIVQQRSVDPPPVKAASPAPAPASPQPTLMPRPVNEPKQPSMKPDPPVQGAPVSAKSASVQVSTTGLPRNKHLVKSSPSVHPRCVLVRPDLACVQAPQQKPGDRSILRELIVNALRSADIQLCRGEALTMYRLNRMMQQQGKNSQIQPGQIALFAQSLQGRLGDASLPEEIQISCPK